MADFDIKDFTLGTAKTVKGVVVGGKVYPGHVMYDETGAEILGQKTDAKSTATDTTAVTFMSVLKQISASIQAAAASVAGTLTATVSLAAAQTLATVTTVSTVTAVTAISNALPAGTNLLGKVKTKFINATGATTTRPANQTPYAVGDAVSDNATAGSVTAKSVTISDVTNDLVSVERIRLVSTDTGVAAKAFRVWLYNADPTASSGVVGGDNAAFSNKMNGFIGTLSGTFRAFSDGSVAVLVPDEGARLITAPTSGAATLYYQMQTLDIFTSSANSTTFIPTFEAFQGAA